MKVKGNRRHILWGDDQKLKFVLQLKTNLRTRIVDFVWIKRVTKITAAARSVRITTDEIRSRRGRLRHPRIMECCQDSAVGEIVFKVNWESLNLTVKKNRVKQNRTELETREIAAVITEEKMYQRNNFFFAVWVNIEFLHNRTDILQLWRIDNFFFHCDDDKISQRCVKLSNCMTESD